MSQTAQSKCPQCGTPVTGEQSFCPGCGASVTPSVEPTAMNATVAAPGPAVPPTVAAPEPGAERTTAGQQNPPSSPNYPSYSGYNTGSAYPDYASQSNPEYPSYVSEAGASAPYNHTQYATPAPPPPPPEQTMASAPMPGTYPSIPSPAYPFSTTTGTQRPPWLIPVIIVMALIIVAGVLAWAVMPKGGSTTTGPGTTDPGNSYASEQTLNLSTTYSSVEMTFTSLEQKNEFEDDSYTQYTYDDNDNWIRLNFKESLQDVSYGTYFSYTDAFTLTLPDGTKVKGENAKERIGIDNGVERENWVDFGTKEQVDLAQLKLTLGSSDEKQFEFSLQDGADMSAFEPISVKPDTTFQYAGADWKLTEVVRTYYYDGSQAKNKQIFLLVYLTVSNNTDEYIYLEYDFLRLKAGSSTLASESSSIEYLIDAHTVGLDGAALFAVEPTDDGTYTLIFPKNSSEGYAEKTIDFQIQ